MTEIFIILFLVLLIILNYYITKFLAQIKLGFLSVGFHLIIFLSILSNLVGILSGFDGNFPFSDLFAGLQLIFGLMGIVIIGIMKAIFLPVFSIFIFIQLIVSIIAIRKVRIKRNKNIENNKSESREDNKLLNSAYAIQNDKTVDASKSNVQSETRVAIIENLKKRCPKCGTGNAIDAEFCFICNHHFEK